MVEAMALFSIVAVVSIFALVVYGGIAPEPLLPPSPEPDADLWRMNRGELVEEATRLRGAVRNLCDELRNASYERDMARAMVPYREIMRGKP